MTSTEIKKEVYKKRAKAYLTHIRKGSAYYNADLEGVKIYFEVPVNDMGDADFIPIMEASLLLRWLVQTSN